MNLSENSFVAVDLETTGTDANRDSIIEIGAVKYENGSTVDSFSTYVRCDQEQLSPKVASITGITYEQLQDAPSINSALNELYDFVGDSTLVAHNFKFVSSFLRNWGFWCNLDFDGIIDGGIDVSAAAKKKLDRSVKNYKIRTVAEFLNVGYPDCPHSADDAEACAQIALALEKI